MTSVGTVVGVLIPPERTYEERSENARGPHDGTIEENTLAPRLWRSA